jgi:hypothetical protein
MNLHELDGFLPHPLLHPGLTKAWRHDGEVGAAGTRPPCPRLPSAVAGDHRGSPENACRSADSRIERRSR